jgi:hypothetical protein
MVTPPVPPQSRLGHAPRLRPLERARGVITAYVRLSSSQPRSAMSLPLPCNRHTCWLQSAAGIGWAGSVRGHGNRDVLSGGTLYDLSTPSSNAVFVIGRGAQRRQSAIGAPALELISSADPVIATSSSRRLGVRRAARNSGR